MRRAPSLYQWETPIKANSAEASNESNLDTPNLKRNESVKRNDVRDKEAYMQDMPEAVHHDRTSADSVKSVVKISECWRTPVKCEQ